MTTDPTPTPREPGGRHQRLIEHWSSTRYHADGTREEIGSTARDVCNTCWLKDDDDEGISWRRAPWPCEVEQAEAQRDALRAEVAGADARAADADRLREQAEATSARLRAALREIDGLSSDGYCVVGSKAKAEYIRLMGFKAQDALADAPTTPAEPGGGETDE